MRKKIPYGISNFDKLISENYYYVDKTKFIEKIENLDEPYVLFLRPRRFGKSLFLSVLDNYYDKNKKESADKLFSEYYIGKNPTPLKNTYNILYFNFSGVSIESEDKLLYNFKEKVVFGIEEFCKNYNLIFNINFNSMPAAILEGFLLAFKNNLNGKIFVLIDEYDHFSNDLLSYQTKLFEEVVAKTGFFRKFFEVLKIGTSTIVDRIFITGVSPFTLDSLTSGFNIASDISLSERFNEIMGFTEDEIIKVLSDFSFSQSTINEILPVLKVNYNGYLFNYNGTNRIYNSDMILYFLKDFLQTGSIPKNLIDDNIATSYYKLKQYINLGNLENNLKIIEDLLENKTVYTALTTKFDLAQNFRTDDLKSLFFYMGLLTIESKDLDLLILKIPNYVIKELYFKFFSELLENETKYYINATEIGQAVTAIAKNGDISSFITLVETVLLKLSNRDYQKFNEKYVKTIMLTYLFLSKIYLVKTEYEVEEGFIDIALLPRANIKAPNYAIIEVKYLKKEKYTKAKLNVAKKEAKIQLAKYNTSEELKSQPNLLKFVVVFKGDKCVCAEKIE